MDFGTQNAECITRHYSQSGKEGPQKINTVGILLSLQVTQHSCSVLDCGNVHESIWSIFVCDFQLEPLTDVQML